MTIAGAARELGCCRPHLSLVLNGHRESKSLTARFQALVEEAESKAKGDYSRELSTFEEGAEA